MSPPFGGTRIVPPKDMVLRDIFDCLDLIQRHGPLVDSPHIAPIGGRAGGLSGNLIGLEIVGEHLATPDQRRQNVPAEIVLAVRIGGVVIEPAIVTSPL